MNYSLIIPIYNEGRSLNKLLKQLQKLDRSIEIIIIDDGSNDNTKSILECQSSFKVIKHQKNLGKGASIISGINDAKHDNIILMDGDLEVEMNSVIKAIKVYENNYPNIVINGCRWNKKSNPGFSINTYGNSIINFIFNNLYKTNITDVLCCVKIFEKELFNSLNITSKSFSIEIEVMSKLALKKRRFNEVDVVYNRRSSKDGKKLKISDAWGILWKMLKIRLNNN
jgi:glycosyltransferase involved in cell wall biosynthesis